MAKSILIIEDDPGVADAVMEKLSSAGYEATICGTGQQGLAYLRETGADLVVLDLQLPDMDGFDVCRNIRRHARTPVIILTARVEETDRITGLELGADDYVVKPFSPKELVARVRAVLRRGEDQVPPRNDTVYRYAGLELDEQRHEVKVDGQRVALTAIEYKILGILLRSPGSVVPREQLIKGVWGYDGFSANLLQIHVGHLRRKIEPDPHHPKRLLTVRGFGYKLVEGG